MNVLLLDIETTGLDPEQHQILQIYAGLFDPFISSEIIRETNFVIHHSNLNLTWNAYILNSILIKKSFNEGLSKEAVIGLLGGFLNNLPKPFILAGKNVAGFDRPFVEKFLGQKIDAHYRTLDPSILYMNADDIAPPGLEECLVRANIPYDSEKFHDAKYDSECIAKLLYKHFHPTKEF